jgi:TRAP-type C4-dicarboxylate transport system substrate-binding protein
MLVRSAHRILIGVTVLGLVVGCSPISRGVGSQQAPVTLTLASPFEGNGELQPFVDAVARLSDGTLQIAFKPNVHKGDDAPEASLLGDVAAGTYDMTWTAQRPWPARGDMAFDALVAPFLVDSYDLERAILEDPIAQQMISSVKEHGLVGIGVLPGPLRFLAAHDAVRAPSDLKRALIGIDDSWVGQETVKALGGTVTGPTTDNLDTLKGAVAQLGAIVANRWNVALPVVAAGVPFWPRPVIVVMNQARFDALSDGQRRILHDAAVTSIARRTEQLADEDELAVQGICLAGSIPVASAADRLAFRSAVASVYHMLDRDAATASFIRRIDELKAGLAAKTPYACEDPVGQGSQPPALGIPDGTYRLSLTPDEVDAWIRANKVPADAKIEFPAKDCPCTFSFTVHGTDLVDETKDRWKLSYFGADHVSIGDFAGTFGFRWSYADDKLTLSDITGGTWDDASVWTIKPYQRDR